MSQFSELLREYIKKKDITIKALAEKCGIDRTYLHKILKGERKVPSVDFVENISLQLMLSTEDKSRLMELYNISEMGEDVYNRRKQVSKIIHDMANTNMEDPDALTFKTEVDIDSVPEISIYIDKRELRKNLQVLICSDVHNGSDIQVIAQPTEFLTNLLSIAAEGSESAINHLFFFDNTSGEKSTAKYNLDIFPFICHLAQKHEKYEAFYYYEGASAYFNSTNIMPNIMITNNFLIRTDSDYCEGVIYRSKPMVEFYMRQFEKFKTKCAKLLDHAVNILEYVYFWYDDNANFIGVDFQPCTMLCLTEDIYKVRENNFSLNGLMGLDFHGKTAGIIGTGRIGAAMCRICHGFGMRVIAYDVYQNPDLDFVKYYPLSEVLRESDLISLHCPLTESSYHLINTETISLMKENVVFVNTSRGALVNTEDLIKGIRSRKFHGVGLDVYEEETENVFENRQEDILESSVTARLLSFPNVIVTSHQGFFTEEALAAISRTTFENACAFERGRIIKENQVK